MTWSEFKEYMDTQLTKQGISLDVDIEYIDISWPNVDDLSVTFENNMIAVT